MSTLSVFCTQLVNFFEELSVTIPEEKDIKKALEMVKMGKTANPRLLSDVFYEHIYKEFGGLIATRDIENMVVQGKKKILNSYNEVMPAIMIFDKYWGSLSSVNQNAIWSYLDVLCKLVVRTR